MLADLRAATLLGLDGRVIRVEVDVAPGLPGFTIVGLADAALQEARERSRARYATRGSSPAPPDHRQPRPGRSAKAGASLDLAIAMGIRSGSEQVRAAPGAMALIGELSLGGELRAVPGTFRWRRPLRRTADCAGSSFPTSSRRRLLLVEGNPGNRRGDAAVSAVEPVLRRSGTADPRTLPPRVTSAWRPSHRSPFGGRPCAGSSTWVAPRGRRSRRGARPVRGTSRARDLPRRRSWAVARRTAFTGKTLLARTIPRRSCRHSGMPRRSPQPSSPRSRATRRGSSSARRPHGRLADELPRRVAGDRCDDRRRERLRIAERRQQPGDRPGEQRLARPGGPTSSSPWPPARAISSAAARLELAADLGQVGDVVGDQPATRPQVRRRAISGRRPSRELDPRRRRSPSAGRAAVGRLDGVAERRDARRPRSPSTSSRLVDRRRRDDDPPHAAPGERRDHRQDPGHRPDLAAERQLADEGERPGRRPDLLRPEQDPERDREVERRARLALLGRGEVDGDPPRRMDEAGVADRAADPLARLLERGVGEADDREARAAPGRRRPRPG